MIEDRVRRCILQVAKKVKQNFGDCELPTDQDFSVSLPIDSLGFILLISELEREFQLEVDLEDYSMANMNTVEKLSSYIKRKKAL